MNRFFHVDRNNRLRPQSTVTLSIWGNLEPTGLQNHINHLFPEGFSTHGDTYLLGHGIQDRNLRREEIIEIIFEYVRRSSFADKPSRYQSFFAFESLGDAKKFKNDRHQSGSSIWEIEGECSFKADMRLLEIRRPLLGTSLKAHLYWSGEFSIDPFWEILLLPPIKIIRQIE